MPNSNEVALSAFMAAIEQIKAELVTLQEGADNHLGCDSSKEINWAHVGLARELAADLRATAKKYYL